jgi:hypothetical protein
MASKRVAFLLADLGVTKTHSRPHTSNDNPFSELHFKTLKYRAEFPDRLYSLAEAPSLPFVEPTIGVSIPEFLPPNRLAHISTRTMI